MKIATFNVNSIRARIPVLVDWLSREQPDLVAVQEIKVEDEKFPFDDLANIGYIAAVHGQKSYHGVAFLSQRPVEILRTGYHDDLMRDCRVQACMLDGIKFINTYVPNGNTVGGDKWAYKMAWLERFPEFCSMITSPDEKAIWLGDINIAPTPDDVFESDKHLGDVGHHPDEFARLDIIKQWGWTDCFRQFTLGPGHYTFWDYRMRGSYSRNLGWRIDHIYATAPLLPQVKRCWIDKYPRELERPSDHTALLAEIEL